MGFTIRGNTLIQSPAVAARYYIYANFSKLFY